MKFRFCGEGDCPDWVLAEIISTLSLLTAQQLETVTQHVAKKLIGETFEEDDVKAQLADVAGNDKSAVACIHYLLVSAARHNTSESVFDEEMQQLGLPKDHAAGMCRILTAHAKRIRQKLIDKAFRINELTAVQHLPPSEEAIDCARLELKIGQELVDGLPQDTTHCVNIDRPNLLALLEEMREALAIMQKYDLENVEKIEI